MNKVVEVYYFCANVVVISDTPVKFFLDVLYLLLAVISLELYEKLRRNKD